MPAKRWRARRPLCRLRLFYLALIDRRKRLGGGLVQSIVLISWLGLIRKHAVFLGFCAAQNVVNPARCTRSYKRVKSGFCCAFYIAQMRLDCQKIYVTNAYASIEVRYCDSVYCAYVFMVRKPKLDIVDIVRKTLCFGYANWGLIIAHPSVKLFCHGCTLINRIKQGAENQRGNGGRLYGGNDCGFHGWAAFSKGFGVISSDCPMAAPQRCSHCTTSARVTPSGMGARPSISAVP